jgi:membrane protein
MIAIARSSFDAQVDSGSFSQFASGCARSANAAMKSLFDTLNVVYGEKEKRGFVKLNAIFTVAGIVFALLAISGVAILPVHLNLIGLANFTHLLVRIARWPAMLVALGMALAVIYR